MTRAHRFTKQQARYGTTWLNWESPQEPSAAFLAKDELGCGSSDGAAHGYADALSGELGVDPRMLYQLSGDELVELGFSLKKIARGVGKGLKAAVKVAAPVLKVAGTVTAFVVPAIGVPMVAAAAGADKLISAAQKGSKAAKQAYKATKGLAAKGHPDAKRALAVLDRVQKERKKKGVAPGASLPVLQKPAAVAQLKVQAKALQAPAPAKPIAAKPAAAPAKPAAAPANDNGVHAGFLVTPGARVRQVRRFRDGSLKDSAA